MKSIFRSFVNNQRKKMPVNKYPDMIDGVKISYEKPPIWDAVCVTFKINPRCYFTYGDTLYNPSKLPIPPEIIAHEKVHIEQQKATILIKHRAVGMSTEKPNIIEMNPALWWGKFLREPEFRIDQEAKAYGRQYEYICSVIKDDKTRTKYLEQLAESLSGPLYNSCVSKKEAVILIQKYSG